MKTITLLLIPVIAASLLLAQPAEAQKRDTTVTISSFAVAGPPHSRPSLIQRGQSHRHGAYHAQRPYRSHRHTVRNEQARRAEWYASTALAQVTHARRIGCASRHPRWSTSYQDHYNWAYTSSRDQIMREIERRDHQLASCGYYRR